MVDRAVMLVAFISAVIMAVIMIAVSVSEHKRAKALVAEVIEQLDKKGAVARIDIEEVGVNVCLYSANKLRKLSYTLSVNGKRIQTASSMVDACNTEKTIIINK